jgi:hypothetical protein
MTAIQIKRGTANNWYYKNPILKNGELGIETDTKKIKLGNGTNQWRSLAYINVVPADFANTIGSYLESGEKGTPGGLATLNIDGVIPDSQIPSTIARDTEIVTSYNNLTDKPNLFSGSYNNLTDKPNLFSGSYTNLTDKPTLFSGSYNDLSNKPTIPSLTGYATETYVGTAISNLVDSAPGTLNTLNELAAAINDDASYAATITTALGNKLDSNYVTIGNTLLDGISGSTYGLIGTSDYLDVKNTNGYNKEIELDIVALESKLDTDGYIKQAALDNKSDKLTLITAKSTSYTVQTTDLGKLIEMSNGGTISIEDSASFPEGFTIDILQTGGSQVTFAGIGTTVINATPGLKLRTQWSSATLIKRTLDVWVLLGDLAA